MELFDTNFVYFGQVLVVSGLRTLIQVTYMYLSGKITTVPRLFSEHSLQNENKHQIMKVHIQWNSLIPILSSLVKYLFQA